MSMITITDRNNQLYSVNIDKVKYFRPIKMEDGRQSIRIKFDDDDELYIDQTMEEIISDNKGDS